MVVPEIKKNLLYVSRRTSDYPCVEFCANGFLIKDMKTKAVIASGSRSSGLYVLKPREELALFSTRFRSATDVVWHKRLGHPQARVVELLKKNKLILSSSKNKDQSKSNSCQMAKACRLPYIQSNEFCTKPFGIVHCDLWGPSTVTSF